MMKNLSEMIIKMLDKIVEVLGLTMIKIIVGLLAILLIYLMEGLLVTAILLAYTAQIISYLFFDKSISMYIYRYLFNKKEVYNWEKVLAFAIFPTLIPVFILIYIFKNSFTWLSSKDK
jgi:hypothetical protein